MIDPRLSSAKPTDSHTDSHELCNRCTNRCTEPVRLRPTTVISALQCRCILLKVCHPQVAVSSVAPRVVGSNPIAHPKFPIVFNDLARWPIYERAALLTLC